MLSCNDHAGSTLWLLLFARSSSFTGDLGFVNPSRCLFAQDELVFTPSIWVLHAYNMGFKRENDR